MTVTVEVFEADNATSVGVLQTTRRFFGSFNGTCVPLGGRATLTLPRWVVTRDGAGEVTSTLNPALALIEHQRLIRFTDDHDDPEADPFVWTMEIEGIADVVASPKGEAGETVTVTGRDWLSARCDKIPVLPDRFLGVLPWHPTRRFNFSADRLRDDDPDGPQGVWPFGFGQLPNYDSDNYFGRPEGFVDTAGPDGNGPEWIWESDTRTLLAGAGIMYFRQRFDLASAAAIWFELAADDEAELWLNGVPLLKAEGVYLGSSVHTTIRLDAGEGHLLSGWCRNRNELRAGVVFAGWTVSDGLPDEIVVRSDSTLCRILGYPSDPPGFTPTEVPRLVLDEWEDSYLGSGLSPVPSFLSASDTAEAEVTEVTDIACKAPADTVLTLFKMIQEAYLDFLEDPLSLAMHAWIRGTAGSDLSASVILEKGTAGKVVHEERSNERANVAIVSGNSFAPYDIWSDTYEDGDPVYTVSLDMGDAARVSAGQQALRYLEAVTDFRHGITVDLTSSGPKPGRDFGVYDTVGVLDRDGTVGAHRVGGVGFDLNADSIVRYSVELEQPAALLEERLGTIMRKQAPGAAGGRTVLPSPVDPSFPSTEKGTEEEHTWQWDGPLGEIQLYKNGVAITGALVDAADLDPGETAKATVTAAARKYVKGADKLTITAGGGAHSPEWVPPKGRWIQEIRATADATVETITITILVA